MFCKLTNSTEPLPFNIQTRTFTLKESPKRSHARFPSVSIWSAVGQLSLTRDRPAENETMMSDRGTRDLSQSSSWPRWVETGRARASLGLHTNAARARRRRAVDGTTSDHSK